MADNTGIEWTDATWNPVTGCTKVSAGCDHCYAATLAERFRGTPGHYFEHGFDVQLRPDKLDLPLRWRKPRKVFVNSMSDLFHDQVPDEYIAQVFAVMALAPQHTFQILTKRHGRMRTLLGRESFPELVTTWAWRINAGRASSLQPGGSEYSPSAVAWPLPNVWLGVSVENQQWADIRIPALLGTPAAVRFLSCEPLLGPVKLDPRWLAPASIACWRPGYTPTREDHAALAEVLRAATRKFAAGAHEPAPAYVDWVIVGGESGRGARPMHPGWARNLRDQCTAASVPFLFKQHGEWAPSLGRSQQQILMWPDGSYRPDTGPPYLPAGWTNLERVGKHAAGRELDGRTWDQYPVTVTAQAPAMTPRGPERNRSTWR